MSGRATAPPEREMAPFHGRGRRRLRAEENEHIRPQILLEVKIQSSYCFGSLCVAQRERLTAYSAGRAMKSGARDVLCVKGDTGLKEVSKRSKSASSIVCVCWGLFAGAVAGRDARHVRDPVPLVRARDRLALVAAQRRVDRLEARAGGEHQHDDRVERVAANARNAASSVRVSCARAEK